MSKDEALKLALELAEDTRRWGESNLARKAIQTITAIKEALALTSTQCEVQPEQEPVAWEQFYPDIGKPQLKQEPVEDVVAYHSDGTRTVRIAPKRPWVGLTEDEVEDCMEMSIQKTCRAVEAKLKEKNT